MVSIAMKENVKSGKYWYLITTIECVVCGRIDRYKERKYTPKPEDFSERVVIKQDMCDTCKYQ